MAKSSYQNSGLPAVWCEVLKKVEATVERTLTEATTREEALQSSAALAVPSLRPDATWELPLQHWDKRLSGFQECVEGADQRAAKADAVLQEAIESLRGWHAAAEALHRKLANWDTMEG